LLTALKQQQQQQPNMTSFNPQVLINSSQNAVGFYSSQAMNNSKNQLNPSGSITEGLDNPLKKLAMMDLAFHNKQGSLIE
jgi:hypothetical protein